MDRCADCKFYVDLKPTLKIGECHRYPPGERGAFSVVPQEAWCGEYRAKPEAPKEGKK